MLPHEMRHQMTRWFGVHWKARDEIVVFMLPLWMMWFGLPWLHDAGRHAKTGALIVYRSDRGVAGPAVRGDAVTYRLRSGHTPRGPRPCRIRRKMNE
ncbi:hypothetical protein LGN19_29850 [Burkholderia sp. AU30198]|uniref:hypothetical protein n=1 Tax=Burkholderia sp. AU30198 TaxID=2879627 RepID=UPI001CF1ACA5|nr:hypothetical protein [Burkholderia sp. AU30198]MCA8298002.1 hypothetical protein [Burkholderia sp. AU30198]